jgi:hypothetical protein
MPTANPNGNNPYGVDANYLMSKRRVEDNYGLSKAAIDYSKSTATRDYGQNVQRFNNVWDQNQRRQPWGWGARGMMNSGAYRNAQNQFNWNRDMEAQGMGQNYQDRMFGFNQQQAQLAQGRSRDLEGLELSEAQRIAALAAQLRGAY